MMLTEGVKQKSGEKLKMSDNALVKLANPAALGLLGFGLTTVLLTWLTQALFLWIQ